MAIQIWQCTSLVLPDLSKDHEDVLTKNVLLDSGPYDPK